MEYQKNNSIILRAAWVNINDLPSLKNFFLFFIETLKVTNEGGGEIVLNLDKDALISGDYADFCDKKFDSCNSRKLSKDKDKPLTQVVAENSERHRFWRYAVQNKM